MDSLLPIDISASALSTNRLRLGLISSNLANQQTTRTPEGGPYRRQDLVVAAKPLGEFQKALENELAENGAAPHSESALFAAHLRGVAPLQVVQDQREPLVIHAPWHPDADKDGNVKMPNISVIEEMVDMINVTRAYEANVTVIKTTKSMVDQALEIGRT
ncbi:MAG: flagellar basal body rod protein FlgC [Candidatus Sumerlaeota bacterium]|nr:flagellar basal body rod protein FlgC [Candidatus Sumerlaeota bacterium]